MIYELSSDLKQRLIEKGAALVGFADLAGLTQNLDEDIKYGVSVVVKMTPAVVRAISDGPTQAYYDEYNRLNKLLDELVTCGAAMLQEEGFKAIAQTTSTVTEFDNYRTMMPHKTVAVRSGLGWIGKCALLVTPQFGSAVRISSILTNAPLVCGVPFETSKCGSCMCCVDACPASAAAGVNWEVSKDRDTFFDVNACRQTARERAAQIGIEATICGKCIESCPHTRQYIYADK